MENIWVCKKCSEEVNAPFDICWNCNSDKSGSRSTFEDIKRETDYIKEKIKNKILDEPLFLNKNIQIDAHKIIEAGRDIKSVVYFVLVMILFSVIAVLTKLYVFFGVAGLLCNIFILLRLYSAGDNLENSVYKKVDCKNTSP